MRLHDPLGVRPKNAGKRNNRINSRKTKMETKKRYTTTKEKKDKTPKVRKPRWMTHVQRTRYMKTKGDHAETKGTKKKSRDNQKNLVFPSFATTLFFATPSELYKTLRIICRRCEKKTPTSENGPKVENTKKENPSFPCFLMTKKRKS